MNSPRRLVVSGIVLLLGAELSPSAERPSRFEDDFSAVQRRWDAYFDSGRWSVRDGILATAGPDENSGRLAQIPPVTDVVVEAEVRVATSDRRNFGLILGAQADRTCLVVRYYDYQDALEVLRYNRGRVDVIPGRSDRLKLAPGRWYRFKAAAIEDMILAKLWPADAKEEPAWQLRVRSIHQRPGRVGVIAQDGTRVGFRNVRALFGSEIEPLRRALAKERQEVLEKLRQSLTMQIAPTPFVLRAAGGPARRIGLRTMSDKTLVPVGSRLSITVGSKTHAYTVKERDFADDVYRLHIPEPNVPTPLRAVFDTEIGKRLEAQCVVEPARTWTFYMTPHTHYDIGFTHPQVEVIEQLARNLDTAVAYCEQTADWPAESRYRWTVEVTGLAKNYIERHSKEQVDGLMGLVRQKRIEVCGYYLNMPTELVGHEELIRCLYYAQELRRRYGIPIDTAMIDDVPGYAWALPQLFVECGIPRVAFRANSIHGQFLWYRRGAVPRPFYWQGPEGSPLFVWYTDSYREGNFFREPGLHEKAFLSIIRQNESAGCTVDDIQLRMGGDNLPPDLDASKNARAWNETYIWPRVVVATNREYLETLERKYAAKAPTFRGDIPSWWAEGPASSAHETGMNRLVHDRLIAAEGLWTLLHLTQPDAAYPHQAIADTYDKMIHFDEHTWGASSSISQPKGEQTRIQWQWKAANAHEAEQRTDALLTDALRQLSATIPRTGTHSVAVWNTLTWPRTGIVELLLAGTPFEGRGIAVVDADKRQDVPVQISRDRTSATFIASDVPALSYGRYTILPAPDEPSEPPPAKTGTLENAFYRVTISPEAGGIASWYDKQLRRELIDLRAAYRANQAIHETPIGGRDVINTKRPVQFKRMAARAGKLTASTAGPVYSQVTFETSLPGCPRIEQTVRLYNGLKRVDIVNVVQRDEVFDPEGVTFAFPFDVPSPTIRLQIADAIMRPGLDQLPLTCHDFYSIQHWADVAGDGFGVIFAPLEAPLVSVSDLNVYKWADTLRFETGHLYSLVMNNTWHTNFKAGQSGRLVFRYCLTSYAGPHDPVRATQFAWQPFYPMQPVWLKADAKEAASPPRPLLSVDGDPVVVSCIKWAEADDAIIVRLLEQRGKPARCRLSFALPGNRRIVRAYTANPVEVPGKPLAINDKTVEIQLRPNAIATIAVIAGGI